MPVIWCNATGSDFSRLRSTIRHIHGYVLSRSIVDDNSAPVVFWYHDSMAWLSLLIGPLIWFAMVYSLSIEVAWVSSACAIIIGFFLWLVALGYENPEMAKATIWGVLITIILSLYSAHLTFL